MRVTRPKRPLLLFAVAAMCATATLAACSPAPEPTPTKTPIFASEKEAFEAAEATYQAYTEATNALDLASPTTFERLYLWTSGPVEESARRTFSEMHAEHLTLSGTTKTLSFKPVSADLLSGKVVAKVCADVSDIDVVDVNGVSVMAASRLMIQPLTVEFRPANTVTRLDLNSSSPNTSVQCVQ